MKTEDELKKNALKQIQKIDPSAVVRNAHWEAWTANGGPVVVSVRSTNWDYKVYLSPESGLIDEIERSDGLKF